MCWGRRFWTLKNPDQKDSDTAKAVITFEYPEVMEGTIDITMIKQDKEWKIDGLSMPHFDKVSLPIK